MGRSGGGKKFPINGLCMYVICRRPLLSVKKIRIPLPPRNPEFLEMEYMLNGIIWRVKFQ